MLPALLALVLMPEASSPEEAEAKATQALTAGDIPAALDAFEEAIRLVPDTPRKLRLRDRYIAAGWAEPRPPSPREEEALAGFVREEKLRVFGLAADRFEQEDRIQAAILMRNVLADLAGGEATDRGKGEIEKARALVRKLTEGPTAEDQADVEKILRAHKSGEGLLKAAAKLLGERRYRAVVRLCQEMMFGKFDQEIQNRAVALRKEAEDKAAADLLAADKEAVRKVLEDERFECLDVARSRHFLFLGPQQFVTSITPAERTLLDLAYIFQSDLASQPLTNDGVRICVYYQETFDFGGGLALAGGKYIRIGCRAIGHPISGMLHYHELGHCIFGRGWLHDGFTEGLADFAAGFSLDMLGDTREAQGFITESREQFVRFFLGRDVRYFDIQPYRPSAGFLFSFLPPGEAPFDWAPYRRVFHRMRDAQFGMWPEQEHQLMRYFGYLLSTEYGKGTLELLQEWGWPVARGDFARVPAEADGLLSDAKRADFLVERDVAEAESMAREVLEAGATGEVAARARYALLRAAVARGDHAEADRRRRDLGIVDAFLVLGPYHARGRTAHVVFPPEIRVDPSRPVTVGSETNTWKVARIEGTGFVNLRDQGFAYPENACAFALAYVHADGALPVRVWTGSDDGHTLYLDGELLEKRATSRAFRFDDDFADGQIRAGWNRLLLKVHNGDGEWGFLARITDRDGKAIPGLRVTSGNKESSVTPFVAPRTKAVPIVQDDFRGLAPTRWRTTVGSFDAQNGMLRPRGTAKVGLWERFRVDPDHPKDGPSNIVWLVDPDLPRADSFDLELVVAAQGKEGLPAKFGLTVDGENEDDAQSGHTFVVDVDDGKLRCHWYRYDQLLFLQPGAEVKPAEEYRVHLRRLGRKWWLFVNDVPLFDGVDVPRLPASGFGILAWGAAPSFASFKLARLDEAR
ncbi:MAG TPA: hypothetical protein VFY93_16575 [Planctomycetota bacterium]|nr:hypothetical protein [Planctomycetota bacterium]